jgi:signal transduction histidine kinase
LIERSALDKLSARRLMLPNERTTHSDVVALPSEVEALVAAGGRGTARALATFLKEEQVNVLLAGDVDRAFEETVLHRPSILLIDDALPPSGGIELCARIKQSSGTHFVPVILVVASATREYRLRAYAAGADAIFDSSTDAQERRTRLWGLLRSSAQHRRAERDRRRQGNAIQARRRWIASFAHDLQNSIGTLQANFEFLAQNVAGRAGDSVLESLQDSRAVFAQIARGIRTVLDFERVESGAVAVRRVVTDLRRIADEARRELVAQLGHLTPPGRVELISPDGGGGELAVSVDPDLMRQALCLLGGYLVRLPRVRLVTLAIARDSARVVVTGAGAQIDEADRLDLFEPYPRSPRRGPLGSGLGLALARAIIVDVHGGGLSVEDAPGGDLGFVAALPSLACAELAATSPS